MNFNKPTWALPAALLGMFFGWHLLCAGIETAEARRQARAQAEQDISDAAIVASRAFANWTVEQRMRQSNGKVVRDLSLAALGHATLTEVDACPAQDQSTDQYIIAWIDDVPAVTPASVAGVWDAVGHFHDINGIGRVYRVTVVRGGHGLEAADVQLLPAEAPDGQEKATGQ